MITRKEAIEFGKELYAPKSTYSEKMYFVEKLVNVIYDQLEAQLDNTEQLTCEGCIYSICDATTYAECASACYKCIRQKYRVDNYNFALRTKDTK